LHIIGLLAVVKHFQKLNLSSLITGFLFPGIFPLNPWCTPPLRLQVSDCSTYLIMRNVPSAAVFVQNLLNAFLVLFTDILSSLVTIPVATVITGMMKHFSYSAFAEFLYLDS